MADPHGNISMADPHSPRKVDHQEADPEQLLSDSMITQHGPAPAADSGRVGVTASNKGGATVLVDNTSTGGKAPWTSLFANNRKFVESYKLQKTGDHAQPVFFDSHDVDDLETTWGYCVVRFLADRFPGRASFETLMKQWGAQCKLVIHASGWVLFRFLHEKDKLRVIGNGSYSIFGRPLILKEMSKYFTFDDKFLSVVPCWINLPGLPLECWNARALSKVASAIGSPIAMDRLTAERECILYARILVEVDTSAPIVELAELHLPCGATIAQTIVFETIPRFCTKCKRIGHVAEDCSSVMPIQGTQRNARDRSNSRMGTQARGTSRVGRNSRGVPGRPLRRGLSRGEGNPAPNGVKGVNTNAGTSGVKGHEAYMKTHSAGLGNAGPAFAAAARSSRDARPDSAGVNQEPRPELPVPRPALQVPRPDAQMPQPDCSGAKKSTNPLDVVPGQLITGPMNPKTLGSGNIISSDRLLGVLTQNSFLILGGPNVGTSENPVTIVNLVDQVEAEPETQPLEPLSQLVPPPGRKKIMDEDVFVAKLCEFVNEDEYARVLMHKEVTVSEEEELEREVFVASILRLINKELRYSFIDSLTGRRAKCDKKLAELAELASESSDETESSAEDIEPVTVKPVDDDDFTPAGRGSRAKKRRGGRGSSGGRRGRGGRGNRKR